MTKKEIETKIIKNFENDLDNFTRQEMIDFYEALEEIGREGQEDMAEIY